MSVVVRAFAFAAVALMLLSTTGCGLAGGGGGDEAKAYAQQDAARALHNRTVAAYGGELESVEVTRYVGGVGRTIPGASSTEIYLLRSDEVNHFTLPGKIYVTRGLLSRLDNEAQLVAVLALEQGHVKNNTVQNRIAAIEREARKKGFLETVQGVFVKKEFNLTDVWTTAVQPKENGQFGIQFTEREEDQAQVEALGTMAQLGYDPEQYFLYLDTMLKASKGNDPKAQTQVTFTHDFNARRGAKAQEQIAAIKKQDESKEWKVGSRPYREGVLDHLKPTAAALARRS